MVEAAHRGSGPVEIPMLIWRSSTAAHGGGDGAVTPKTHKLVVLPAQIPDP